MKIELNKDGISIASGFSGGNIVSNEYGISINPAYVGWAMVVAATEGEQFPPAGEYEIVAVADAPLGEPEPLTPEQQRENMPSLTPAQFRLMLMWLGHDIDQIAAAIDGISDPIRRQRTKIYWEYATEFVRTDSLLISMAENYLEMDAEAIDNAWMGYLATL